MTPLEEAKAYVDEVANATGLEARFVAAIVAAEHGTELMQKGLDPNLVNNPADLSLGATGDAPKPDGELPNGVNEYPTWAKGAAAFAMYLNDPPPEARLDMAAIRADLAAGKPYAACVSFCASAYASGHYGATQKHPGGLLWSCYLDPYYKPLWESAAPEMAAPAVQVAEARLAAAEATTAPAPPPSVYYTTVVVRPGDTLTAIAIRENTNVPKILAANPDITDPNLLTVGEKIRVPHRA